MASSESHPDSESHMMPLMQPESKYIKIAGSGYSTALKASVSKSRLFCEFGPRLQKSRKARELN